MTDVPSNLIPTRITQLPLAPVADENSLMMIVYQGNNYQIRVGDLLSVAGVPLTRQVIAGTGLTGGGQLSSNVTLSIAIGGVGSTELSTTGVAPGVYGNQSNVPVFTVDANGRITAATTLPIVTSQANNLSGGGSNRIAYQTSTGVTGFIVAPTVGGTVLKWDGSQFIWDTDTAGTVTSVDASGGTTGLSFSGGPIISSGTLTLSGTLSSANGGTGLFSYTPGDLLYYSTGTALTKLPIGSSTYLLASNGSVPGWSDPAGITVGTATNATNATTATNIAGGAANKVVYNTNSGVTSFIDAPVSGDTFLKWTGSAFTWAAVAGAGTVTSVDVSGGTTGLTTSGGPVTTSGTITLAGTLAVANGGTGATNATTARTNLSAAASGANTDITSMASVTGGISSPDFIQFDAAVSPLPTDATAKIYYDNNDQYSTLSFQMNGSVIQKIGEEQYFRVKCSSAVTKGQVVMFSGTVGASGGLTVAPATGLTATQANYLLGVAAEAGNTNDWIFVTYFGEIKGLNTTGGAETWVAGDVLYYNPSVTGGLTKTKPATPNAIAIMAAVVYVSASNGILFIRPTYGTVFGGTDGNVQFGTLNNGDVVVYDGTDLRWENVAQSTLSVGSATTATTATNVAGGAAGSLVYQSGAATTTTLGIGASTYLLTSTGSAPQWSAPSGVTVGSATSATNLAGGIASQIPYQTGAGATSFIANGTAGQVLKSNGTSAPSWADIDGGTF